MTAMVFHHRRLSFLQVAGRWGEAVTDHSSLGSSVAVSDQLACDALLQCRCMVAIHSLVVVSSPVVAT
jgi:hypothetical protein